MNGGRTTFGDMLILALVGIIVLLAMTLIARADEAQIRKQFFYDAKRAILVTGEQVNCCGEGDATRVKIIGASAGHLAAEIVDPMKHPTAKVGEVYTVPRSKIVRRPHAPDFLGTILFISVSPVRELRRVYCLNPQAGG